jgi:hypothetical protein
MDDVVCRQQDTNLFVDRHDDMIIHLQEIMLALLRLAGDLFLGRGEIGQEGNALAPPFSGSRSPISIGSPSP